MEHTDVSSVTDMPKSNVRSINIPHPPSEENIVKLKDSLIKEFPDVFVKSTPFKTMNCKPVHIHLKQNAIPSAIHVPIPVPIHWKDEVKASLDKDVASGIIESVPIGEPVSWCSPMVVVAKKDEGQGGPLTCKNSTLIATAKPIIANPPLNWHVRFPKESGKLF